MILLLTWIPNFICINADFFLNNYKMPMVRIMVIFWHLHLIFALSMFQDWMKCKTPTLTLKAFDLLVLLSFLSTFEIFWYSKTPYSFVKDIICAVPSVPTFPLAHLYSNQSSGGNWISQGSSLRPHHRFALLLHFFRIKLSFLTLVVPISICWTVHLLESFTISYT